MTESTTTRIETSKCSISQSYSMGLMTESTTTRIETRLDSGYSFVAGFV